MRRTRPWLLIPILVVPALAGCPSSNPTVVSPAPKTMPWFEDVTRRVGLTYTHDCGPINDQHFFPQISGSGAATFDFDGDGRLDFYLIHNGGPNGKKNQLFHQEEDGTFRDVSAGSGLDVAGYGQGVAIGDVNNDGRPDVLLTEYGATRLFLNLGAGKFREVTHEAGLDNPLWATSAAFFDFDRDGHLDLIVVNYVDHDASIRCKNDFCGPVTFSGSVPRLYRNLGPQPGTSGVRFADVTVASGLGAVKCKGLGVLCADFNGDRWPDILVASDWSPNHLWINQKNGTFKDEAVARGVAYVGNGGAAANMGVAWADVDGNGLPDLFITHISDELHTLWLQQPRGIFQDRTVAAGLHSGKRTTGFGAALVDFDRDGWPDLAFVNGGVYRNPGAAQNQPFWTRYAQQHRVFQNTGGGKFRDISDANPALCGQPGVGRGLVVADFDNDGAPDLLVTEVGAGVRLLRNVAPAAGHWLAVRALMPKLNRDAYGAEIVVTAGGKKYWRMIQPGYSYCCSNDVRAYFGLGASADYDSLRVIWPDGSEETFPGGRADQQIEVRQSFGKSP